MGLKSKIQSSVLYVELRIRERFWRTGIFQKNLSFFLLQLRMKKIGKSQFDKSVMPLSLQSALNCKHTVGCFKVAIFLPLFIPLSNPLSQFCPRKRFNGILMG
jgi:hypothetical protein